MAVQSVRQRAAAFERKSQRRVVITGHGSYVHGRPKIVVPGGKRIHFYVAHGVALANDVGMAVEGLDGGVPPKPYETKRAGDAIPDYILTYPSGLLLNGSQRNAKYDWITVSHRGQAVALSTLLKDSRCQYATDIHWAACRSRADWLQPDTHDAGYAVTAVKYAR